MGSTIALSDATGGLPTSYTYAPFGATNLSGTATGSAFGYTGREDDGTELKYYRARYYHPGLQRFISEDPIEFEAGDLNLYAYVTNDPVNQIDPTGEYAQALIGAATSVAVGWGIAALTGQCYSLGDALVDAGTGALGVGIFDKIRTLHRLYKLRTIASEAGMALKASQKATEVYKGSHYATIEIKHVGNVFTGGWRNVLSGGGGLNPQASWVPRASVRATAGVYVDPFTGATGILRSSAAHIPLQVRPLTEAPLMGGLQGLANSIAGRKNACQ